MPTAFRETAGLDSLPHSIGRRLQKRDFRRISLSNGETMTSITAIFFDLDGTLVDSSIGIHNAFTHTFKELGIPALMPKRFVVLWDRPRK